MASLGNSNGKFTVQFVDADGKRKSVRLGKVDRRTAESTKRRIEALLSCKIQGIDFDADLAKWVAAIGAELHGRLSAVGLLAGRKSSRLLGAFIRAHIAERTDLEPSTRVAMRSGMLRVTRFFGDDRNIASISPADIDRWVIHLGERGYALPTIGRTIRRAKEFFNAAMREGIIDKNPVKAEGHQI